MKKPFVAFMGGLLLALPASAEDNALSLKVKGVSAGEKIAEKFAFCAPDGLGKTRDGGNMNPEISWSGAPAGTKSFALIVVDKDVPAKFDDANQEGKVIAEDFPRQDFYHWVLVDIPTTVSSIAEGADSDGVRQSGKPVGKTAYGLNGQNDYASFMKGAFGGYDGPCPPWNDARLHHYHFQLYALNVETLGLEGAFGGKEAMEKINAHKVGGAEVIGTYSNFIR